MAEKQQLVTGIHAVEELLRQRPDTVSSLLLVAGRRDKRLQRLRELAVQARISIDELDKRAFERQVSGQHQGVAALATSPRAPASEGDLQRVLQEVAGDPLVLVLDGITDPHNLGACLRSADAAGITAVVVPKDNAAPLNATVRKVACGAAETVTLVRVTNLARCLDNLKELGLWIVGTDDGATTSLFDQDLRGPLALVMGSEGAGLRRLTREKCDFLVAIPMAGEISSLNVSVATGISLFEAVRQRRQA